MSGALSLYASSLNTRGKHHMARSGRKRKTTVTLPTVHDRKTTDAPTSAYVAAVEVDDPYETGGKIVTLRNLRDDPLGRLHDRKQIDEAQYLAGREFQADWERAEKGPQAIDPSKEAVDGGTMPDPIDEGQTKALVRINGVLRQLGADGSAIVHDVLVHGLTMDRIADRRGFGGKSWVEYFGKRFRECLDSMAIYYGLAMPKKVGTRG